MPIKIIKGGLNQLRLLEVQKLSAISASIRAAEYNLFLGAGASLDSRNKLGPLPNGTTFKDTLCKLTGARNSSSLQRIFSNLDPAQIEKYVTARFAKCEPGATALFVPQFLWRRIFTINIDDCLEAAYKKIGGLQRRKSYHFKDTFEEQRTLEQVQIIHLHGWAEQPDRGYVFARSEYARVMSETNAWMTVLAELMPVEPFIIAGTSLDEIDLEYYLARRNSESSRQDRGESFFVEPFPDGQTENDCERYGLTLYHGTLEQFFDEVDFLVPRRQAPIELLPENTRAMFPEIAPKSVVLSFAGDFNIVPNTIAPGGSGIKFAYGSPPEWSDLAAGRDVGRSVTTKIRSFISDEINNIDDKIIILLDNAGTGKTTILKRIAFDLAGSGVLVVECSALSRLDFQATAEAVDLIDGRIVVIIDNFAEQATSISQIVDRLEKRDVIFLCAERSYRRRHLVRALGDLPYRFVEGGHLGLAEAIQLVSNYVGQGFSASENAARNPERFAERLVGEPISVAGCHILNNMRPIDGIVESTYNAADKPARARYLIAALAQFCFAGGIRYEILTSSVGAKGISEQLKAAHPLPITFFDSANGFIMPLNSTLAVRTLERAPIHDVAKAFERLAHGIAPRVNREAIRRRAPEARLAGRLFDYEDVIRRFLRSGAGEFYKNVQRDWQWNSRYWEQVALFNLACFRSQGDEIFLLQAVQHARHAVAIEPHPFPLTTLGKVLLAQIGQPGLNNKDIYSEAQGALKKAVEIEHSKGRASVHAYVTLFRGTNEYLDYGEHLSDQERSVVRDLVDLARRYFPKDRELRELADQVYGRI